MVLQENIAKDRVTVCLEYPRGVANFWALSHSRKAQELRQGILLATGYYMLRNSCSGPFCKQMGFLSTKILQFRLADGKETKKDTLKMKGPSSLMIHISTPKLNTSSPWKAYEMGRFYYDHAIVARLELPLIHNVASHETIKELSALKVASADTMTREAILKVLLNNKLTARRPIPPATSVVV